MKKLINSQDFVPDKELLALLAKRHGLLNNVASRKLQEELTVKISTAVRFLAILFPKEELRDADIVYANQLAKADQMRDIEGNIYLPVFTTIEEAIAFKPNLSEGEFMYIVTKKDLLSFLNNNLKTAACVVNPGKDDLLLYRVILQNLIAVEKGII